MYLIIDTSQSEVNVTYTSVRGQCLSVVSHQLKGGMLSPNCCSKEDVSIWHRKPLSRLFTNDVSLINWFSELRRADKLSLLFDYKFDSTEEDCQVQRLQTIGPLQVLSDSFI